MLQKGLAPILIIILIAAATFGYLIYSGKINLNQTTTQVSQPSPTADVSPVPNGTGETANWKTYTKIWISFKYPENYIVKDSGDGEAQISIGNSEDKFNKSLSQVISINATLENVFADYNQAVKALLEGFKEDDTHHITNQADTVTIITGPYSTLPAVKLENVYERHIYWRYKNGAATAHYANVSKEEANVYDQILSTFKFTK